MCSVEGEPWVGDRERKRARHTSRYPCQPHAIVICSGRDRSPVKGLKMCLLGLLLALWIWATASGIPEVFVPWCRCWAQERHMKNEFCNLPCGRAAELDCVLSDQEAGWWRKLGHLSVPGLSQSWAGLWEHRAAGSFHSCYLHPIFHLPKTQQLEKERCKNYCVYFSDIKNKWRHYENHRVLKMEGILASCAYQGGLAQFITHMETRTYPSAKCRQKRWANRQKKVQNNREM